MFKFDFKAPRIDRQKYLKRVQRHMEVKLREAAHVWLNATVVSLVPVWSGASAATFLQLAAEARFNISISPVVPNRISLGVSNSKGGFIKTKTTFHFQYHTTLEHLVFNEFNNANAHGLNLRRPGPYRFQLAGQRAFQAFAKTVTLPSPWRDRRVVRIRG